MLSSREVKDRGRQLVSAAVMEWDAELLVVLKEGVDDMKPGDQTKYFVQIIGVMLGFIKGLVFALASDANMAPEQFIERWFANVDRNRRER